MKISFTGDVSLTGKLKEAIIDDSLKIEPGAAMAEANVSYLTEMLV